MTNEPAALIIPQFALTATERGIRKPFVSQRRMRNPSKVDPNLKTENNSDETSSDKTDEEVHSSTFRISSKNRTYKLAI